MRECGERLRITGSRKDRQIIRLNFSQIKDTNVYKSLRDHPVGSLRREYTVVANRSKKGEKLRHNETAR